jgi:hypothetical protein
MMQDISRAPELPEIDFRLVSFPSDALSIKRFRTLFPDKFDQPGMLRDGFGDFFLPTDKEEPDHLMQLTRLISAERVTASGAFHATYDHPPEMRLDTEELQCINKSKSVLEDLYQVFKLADSPETARLLIRQVQEEGERQARQAMDRAR